MKYILVFVSEYERASTPEKKTKVKSMQYLRGAYIFQS